MKTIVKLFWRSHLLASRATLMLAASNLSADTHYVSAQSTQAASPYTSWATAALKVQDAVNAAAAGDVVVVTNGTYLAVNVNKPLALVSVNGPGLTFLSANDGRCANLTNGASLSGFTLTNIHPIGTRWGGGLFCSSTNAFVTNCVITGSDPFSDFQGGGVYGGTLYDCVISNNLNKYDYFLGVAGGGAYRATLYNCTLSGNYAIGGRGGGACECTLYNCTLTGNAAYEDDDYGPGAGGGAWGCTLYNCTLTGNSATDGGGAAASILYNCTLTGNSQVGSIGTDVYSGGAWQSMLYNCISHDNYSVWYSSTNVGNYMDSTLNYCCTVPMPTNGVGNITNIPLFLDATNSNFRLQSTSPCINAGNNAYTIIPTDRDGQPRIVGSSVDIGAYEYPYGSVYAGTRYVSAASTNPVPPYANWATAAANIQQAVAWGLAGDMVIVTNGTYPGGVSVGKALTLLSVNGPDVTTLSGGGPCVSLTNGASLSGFTVSNGAAPWCGGGLLCLSTNVFVTNCVIAGNSAYWGGGGAYGGSLYHCTLRDNSAGFFHPDYPEYGWGGGAFGCTLHDCTLIGNEIAAGDGGGAHSSTLYNCTLWTNHTFWETTSSGGAYDCTLYNCTLTGNYSYIGGGAGRSTLYNCTLTGNWAVEGEPSGGGALDSTLYNSILFDNYEGYSSFSVGNHEGSTLNHCCTVPLPSNGVGNITNVPLFVDATNGNLRLQSNSPCINAGNNAYATNSIDQDGNQRIVSSMVDMGAFEYQGAGSGISYAWLQQYGLPTDGSADYTDADSDGSSNWHEWRCDTEPTNALSGLRLLNPVRDGSTNLVAWQSVPTRSYFFQRSTNLALPSSFLTIASNILGQSGTTTFSDTNPPPPVFYRVGVHP